MQIDPVFFDQTGRRWRVTRWLLVVIVTGFVSLPTVFVISALTLQTRPEAQTNTDVTEQSAQIIQFGRLTTKRRGD